MVINFKISKYIKIIFKVLKQCVFNVQQRRARKNSTEKSDSKISDSKICYILRKKDTTKIIVLAIFFY